MAILVGRVRIDRDPTTLSRLIRVLSITPFRLAELAMTSNGDSRHATAAFRVDLGTGSAETLAKRINRLIGVQKLRVEQETPVSRGSTAPPSSTR